MTFLAPLLLLPSTLRSARIPGPDQGNAQLIVRQFSFGHSAADWHPSRALVRTAKDMLVAPGAELIDKAAARFCLAMANVGGDHNAGELVRISASMKNSQGTVDVLPGALERLFLFRHYDPADIAFVGLWLDGGPAETLAIDRAEAFRLRPVALSRVWARLPDTKASFLPTDLAYCSEDPRLSKAIDRATRSKSPALRKLAAAAKRAEKER